MASKKRGKLKKVLGRIFKSLLFLFLFFVIASFAIFFYYIKDLPRPEKFTEKSSIQSTKIFDRTGNTLLFELYADEKREIVPLSQISDNLKKAVISAEDAKFYSHFGMDFNGILRAIKNDLALKSTTFGGSTITQQLIRSTFLNTDKTIGRKIKEAVLTIELERRYSKDQILEWYLNQIPFGPNVYGAEAAAKTFFKKGAKDLTIPEAAVLAALIKSPSYLSPYGNHLDELMGRKEYVLNRMVQENYLTKDEAESAKKEEIKFAENIQPIKAPHFVLYVEEYLFSKYGEEYLKENGLKIYTSLDWEAQQKAEEAIASGVKRNKTYNGNNAALVAINPKNGEILSMVGSADWFGKPFPEGCISGKNCLFDPKVNVATYNPGRQPGSSFKPFVYATAFEKGYTDKDIVVDEETNFGIWGGKEYIPRNYDGKFRGPVTLRSALAQSLNIPAIKVLLDFAGIKDSITTAKNMGITTLNSPLSSYGPSIVLGGGEVKLLDMVSAYGVFATEGLKIPPVSILKIENSKGQVIEENKKTPRRVLEVETTRIMNSVLSDNEARAPIFGLNSPLKIDGYDVAAKTGTTSDYKDGWIIGYSPNIAIGVWAGNNDNTPVNKEPGSVMAGPIWKEFMNKILPTLPNEKFTPPIEKPIEPQNPQQPLN